MRRAAALLALAACGASHGHPGRVDRDAVAARLVGAGATDVRAMLRAPLGYGGLWFDDPACAAQFAAPGAIGADRLAAFAACVASLHLAASERTNPFPDVAVLAYAPGFEVEAQVDEQDRVTWIGYAARHDLRDALPSVTPAALEPLRIAGAALDDAARARLADERRQLGVKTSYAWLKVCVDTDGKVTGAHPREEASPIAGDVFAALATRWSFRPFVAGGRAVPVCSVVRVADPPAPGDADRVLPLPVPSDLGAVVVGPTVLHLVEGDPTIVPGPTEMTEIARRGGRVIASLAYCIDEHGAVVGVRVVRSSGVERYDARLAGGISGWRYAPFVVDGKPQPACSTLKFIFTQR